MKDSALDRELLTEKINKAKYCQDDDADRTIKKSFKDTIKELCNYTERVLESIENSVISEQKDTSVPSMGYIQTSLVDTKSLDKNDGSFAGLYEMYHDDPLPEGLIFIDESYEKMMDIVGDLSTDKHFTGRYKYKDQEMDFTYTLKFYDGFLQAQRLLLRASEYCNVKNAIIFCPYIYKAFYPHIIGEPIPEKAEVDYRFSENKIPAIEGHTLMWNIQIKSMKNIDPDFKTPYGDKTRYVYKFNSPSHREELTCVVPEEDTTVVLRQTTDDGGIILQIDTDNIQRFWGFVCHKIDQDKCKRSGVDIYTNAIDKLPIPNRRIVSRGDLDNVLYQFKGINGTCLEYLSEESSEDLGAVKRYADKYRLYGPDRLHICNKEADYIRKRIYVKFISDSSTKFFDDYVNYVLMYLEHYYPEYEWVGVP